MLKLSLSLFLFSLCSGIVMGGLNLWLLVLVQSRLATSLSKPGFNVESSYITVVFTSIETVTISVNVDINGNEKDPVRPTLFNVYDKSSESIECVDKNC